MTDTYDLGRKTEMLNRNAHKLQMSCSHIFVLAEDLATRKREVTSEMQPKF